MELTPQNAIAYLRSTSRASAEGAGGEILVQSLSAPGAPNTVLKIFDTTAGEKVGTDLRTPAQIKLGKPDTRISQGRCFVLKQPHPTPAAHDLARIHQERHCIDLLATLLPAGSVPDILWFDEPNGILALSCPPPEALTWLKQLRSGIVSMDAATHAGMLLAIIHSSTKKDPALRERFADQRLLIHERLEPALRAATAKNSLAARPLQDALQRLRTPLCLIHGDFVPENIILVPASEITTTPPSTKGPGLAHVLLVDFETAYFGHNAYDVATLAAELLLQGFLAAGKWRAFMMLVDTFWQTYRHTADPELVRAAEVAGGRLLAAQLLARLDGPASGTASSGAPSGAPSGADALVGRAAPIGRSMPGSDFTTRRELPTRVRALALELLKKNPLTFDDAIDHAVMLFDPK